MLKDEDRIFTNLYGWFDRGLAGARKRGDWSNTRELLKNTPDEIVELVRLQGCAEEAGRVFQPV